MDLYRNKDDIIGSGVDKKQPSFSQWSALYTAANEFKSIEPWKWMSDSDLFGIRNPLDGEIGYSCVLGMQGEFLGLAVYLGTEGLAGYLKIQDGGIIGKDKDILHINRCLMASFENRRYLDKSDIDVIKKLNLVFKGNNTLPNFRSYLPGYLPWYLTEDEVSYLTICLQQAKELALRFKEGPNLFTAPYEGHYFVRSQKDGDNREWKEEWIKPTPLKKIVIMVKTIDEKELERLRDTFPRSDMKWETDFFYAPAYVAEKGKRPYFPIVFLYVDSYSCFIFNCHTTTQERYRIEFLDEFLNFIKKMKCFPKEILVRKEELYYYFLPFAEIFKIRIRLVKRLKAVDDAYKSMRSFFRKDNPSS